MPSPEPPAYVGRFAPSPTGPLHLGSLVAALGSHLDARAAGGRWLVRIEDLDAPRCIPGGDAQILRTLERFGLTWDGPVLRQSERLPLYEQALARLRAAGCTFECSCSRRELAGQEVSGYPGTCRDGPQRAGPTATRFRIDDAAQVCFEDRLQGACHFALRALGDVVIRRRDGLVAYQLAVVVDDAAQDITDVVRGADLLASTPWQIALQGALGLPSPRYAHLPLVVEPDGAKLAKSRRSVPLDPQDPGPALVQALQLLRQAPPAELATASPARILEWAVPSWRPERLQGLREVSAPR